MTRCSLLDKTSELMADMFPDGFQGFPQNLFHDYIEASESRFYQGKFEFTLDELMNFIDLQLQDVDSRFIALTADANLVSAGVIIWALRNRKTILLLDPDYSDAYLGQLLDRFCPTVHIDGSNYGTAGWGDSHWKIGAKELASLFSESDIEPQILLSTSGSTGNPRHVRLRLDSIVSNAEGIQSSLKLSAIDSTIVNLSPHYSYGLSVLTSGVIAGIDFHFVDCNFLEIDFWNYVTSNKITYLSGVPFFWESLLRMKWKLADFPSLRILTQAGGRLSLKRQASIIEECVRLKCEFRVMYGQTEAGPRMTIMDWESFPSKIGSVGKPIVNSSIEVFDKGIDGAGEIVFRGPSVMLGYAEDISDLSRQDELEGILHTGDIGYLDSDGYLWVTGRLKRIAKINGIRINLDDIESFLGHLGQVYVATDNERLAIFHSPIIQITEDDLAKTAIYVGLSRRLLQKREIEIIPTLSNGKIDYQELARRVYE
jgi:acyl-CoA synthetase (AMP-forming)/AMP-acid ligase II